ncbi:MAG: hypothetical protein PVG39_00490 [Desulfobacteraceae bacterium]|jgi:hypothetical protein
MRTKETGYLELEKIMLPSELWKHFYDIMPKECKEVVDNSEPLIGIGRHKKIGWYIVGSGQGPCLLWSEKKYE